jgi:hypothetical protein
MKSILAAVGAVKRWIKEVPSGGRGARVVSMVPRLCSPPPPNIRYLLLSSDSFSGLFKLQVESEKNAERK